MMGALLKHAILIQFSEAKRREKEHTNVITTQNNNKIKLGIHKCKNETLRILFTEIVSGRDHKYNLCLGTEDSSNICRIYQL